MQHRKLIFQLFGILLFISVFFASMFHFKVFSYQQVSCQYENEHCSEPILAELNRLKGVSFFSKELASTLLKIQKNNPEISAVQVEKSFPSTLSISFKQQSLVLKIICSDVMLGVSEDGHIRQSANLNAAQSPGIEASQEVCQTLQANPYLDQSFQAQLLFFLQELSEKAADLSLRWEDTDTMVLTNPQQQRVMISKETLSQHFHTYLLLNSQQSLPKDWKSLDLRFQKAVIKF